MITKPIQDVVVCPKTHAPLELRGDALLEPATGTTYSKTPEGYYCFVDDPNLEEVESTTEEYAEDQLSFWPRYYKEWLKPCMEVEPFTTLLEVGCGLGRGVSFFAQDGYEAYGLDIPCLSRFWKRIDNDPNHFVVGDGCRMPFPDNYFDRVFTLGTIEHIGTLVGHYTLGPDYWKARQAFADEIVRVTKPGGRILVTCPNKSCPVDIQHFPRDEATPPGKRVLAQKIYDWTGMTVHPTWGDYFLLSYTETEGIFRKAGATSFDALPLRGYFNYGRFSKPFLRPFKPFVKAWVDHLPEFIRRSPLNPYMLLLITK